MTFQDIISTLQGFWKDAGCAIVQPYDMEVGAGTFHPLTVLRALGPKPWKVAYVQPCRRPADGRYGQNQNRLAHYMQFQVLLKPTPQDTQQLYLDSLSALSITPKAHDIRFVEDDWESPTLGAWGLGWEVWCDGMEVSQFTYFQQIGSLPCTPVSVELTYGLERLAMYIQKKDSVFDIQYTETITYGDLFLENEQSFSKFYLEAADVHALQSQFIACKQACEELLDQNLTLPAYDQCIKASHIFNILDARGALSVSGRQDYIGHVRTLAKGCITQYASLLS